VKVPVQRLPLKVLLVEDHTSTSEVLARLMRRHGHEVHTASTLAGAQESADRNSFDLLISDLGLPDGSGHDLMRDLAKKHRLTGIALSGYGTPSDIVACREADFALHLLKPVDWKVLEAALLEVPPSQATARVR
jgi:DNA-binding response OmpR family regulator